MDTTTVNKNIFSLLPTSDSLSEPETKFENTPHQVTPASKTRSSSFRSDWETDDAVEFKINNDKEHIMKKNSGIIPFKGKECVPLHYVDEEDFPKLGTSSQTPSNSSNKSRKGRKKNAITFMVDSSYIDQRRKERQTGFHHQNNREDPRSVVFAKMEDREAMAKSLSCTKACNNVTRLQENGEYGVCYRSICTFAHSLDELNDPMCGFDSTCRFQNGHPHWDGTVDPTGKCMFRHSNETREVWLKRTGRKLPDLPQTNEKTRESVDQKDSRPNVEAKVEPRVENKVLGSGYAVKSRLDTPATKITLSTPTAPLKNVRGNHVTASRVLTPKKLQMSSNDSSSSDEEEHYRKRSYNRHKRSRSPKTRRISSDTQVIRVPTEELAKMAIQSAFDRGVYNIQVIVE